MTVAVAVVVVLVIINELLRDSVIAIWNSG